MEPAEPRELDEDTVVSPDQPVNSDDEMMYNTQAVNDYDGTAEPAMDTEALYAAQAVNQEPSAYSQNNTLLVAGGVLLALVVAVAVLLLFKKFKKA